jgi:high-affinity nickel-transport protein
MGEAWRWTNVVDSEEVVQTDRPVSLAFCRFAGWNSQLMQRFLHYRPWKMYPLGVVFGLGFDTSSEIALLGLSSLQASKGTSIWLILCFPVLFTVGMCMIDTLDGAGMLVVYTWCDEDAEEDKTLLANEEETENGAEPQAEEGSLVGLEETGKIDGTKLPTNGQALPELEIGSVAIQPKRQGNSTLHNPLIFLYYSTLLTALTVLVALIIGMVQLFSLLQNVIKPEPQGRFWDGVTALSDHYDIVGGAIAGGFVLVWGSLLGHLSSSGYKGERKSGSKAMDNRNVLRIPR